jgi:hypothetical protein
MPHRPIIWLQTFSDFETRLDRSPARVVQFAQEHAGNRRKSNARPREVAMPVLRIGAAALAAAVVLCTFPGCASDIEEADATERILLFSGVELSRKGGFLFGGFVWSPHGINAEGFAMKTLAGGGVYRYRSGAEQIVGRQVLNSVMPGWRFKLERFEASLFAGLDVQTHRFHPDDPGNRLAGTHVGMRFAGDVWWEPSPDRRRLRPQRGRRRRLYAAGAARPSVDKPAGGGRKAWQGFENRRLGSSRAQLGQ